MRVIVAGGGTGGHLYPAISIARALRDEETVEVRFIGSREGLEARIVPDEGLPFHAIPARKLSRRPGIASVGALAVLGWGALRAALLLRDLRPDVVVGTGGYVSAGVVFAAALARVPTLIHEQNAVAGRANRLLGRLVTRVAVTFEESAICFPLGKCVCTGLPIRPEFAHAGPDAARRNYGLDPLRPTLLVVGGSRGARRLNEIIEAALPRLVERRIQVVHQVGKENTAHGFLSTAHTLYHPIPYIDDMASALAAADVVLCRAGASTLAEVTAVGRPALLVPYPYAVDDHQTKNARVLADRGAARLLPEGELTPERLVAELDAILKDPDERDRMRAASAALGCPDAARLVAEQVFGIVRRKSPNPPAPFPAGEGGVEVPPSPVGRGERGVGLPGRRS
jgi:UDP-N-acetylglucosamine--N-acetylmuramyl-(pentapeptide) pyrophosphoryl-undecaprenol N-acetylglucosamine transferase